MALIGLGDQWMPVWLDYSETAEHSLSGYGGSLCDDQWMPVGMDYREPAEHSLSGYGGSLCDSGYLCGLIIEKLMVGLCVTTSGCLCGWIIGNLQNIA